MFRFASCLAAFILLISSVHSLAEETISFSHDVRPILSDKCYKCHGPDESAREAEMRFDQRDTVEHLLSASDEDNELVRRIISDDPDERMPPPDSKLALDSNEIDTLRRWINQGAAYEDHWAFAPIRSPELPSVQHSHWPSNAIDLFVLAKLEQRALLPTSAAGKERLIRRLTFDLTGMAPTLEEIDQFLLDNSADVYERLVDRLLESERYGERMAANWMDVARYSDSYGYQVDRDRRVWPWRDWVIAAFNDNMPYDQFITLQLAGDLLPEATDEQLLATTFNRLHSQKVEGGSVPEEFRVEYVADRTQTLATAFLGLTMECARCHDHKYDPITQKEYYQLFAFFNNIDECGVYSWFTDAVPTPTLLLCDEAKKGRIAEVEDQIAKAEQALDALVPQRQDAFQQWLAKSPDQRRADILPLPIGDDAKPKVEEAEAGDEPEDDGNSQAEGETAEEKRARLEIPGVPGRIAHLTFEDHQDGANVAVPGVQGKAVQLSGDDGIGLDVGNFRRFEPFSVAVWINTPDVKDRAVIYHRSKAWTDAGSRGYQLLIEDGKLSASLIHFWPGNAIRVVTHEPISVNQWHHVVMTNDGSSRADGLRIYVDGKLSACNVVCDNLYKNITGGGLDNITIGERFRDRGFTNGLVDEMQVFGRELIAIEIAQLHDSQSLDQALEAAGGDLSPVQEQMLLAYYLNHVDQPYIQQRAALKNVRQHRSEEIDGIEEIMVMRESSQSRPTYLLKRGAYDAPTDRVMPETPAVFPPFPEDAPRNRLGLAAWLTHPDHPLTARVAVNRIWQLLFGYGFVRTPEDFGSQGSPPTHPKLLDWLARDLIDYGWDLKRLVKTIVMSSTYRQDSTITPELLATDPGNLLLARAPRHRLAAEMIRDNALATSGLLVDKIGGPPAKPYEVSVSFKPMDPDKEAGLYRRSLYTFWKRTAPAPVMMTLDAAKRDVCAVKRERTASPLQALVLMNDPQFVEAARTLAQRLLRQDAEDVDGAVKTAFRMLTSRRPHQQEISVLRQLYDRQLILFSDDVERTKEFLQTGEAPVDEELSAPQLAAMAVVVSTVMNFDECVIKR